MLSTSCPRSLGVHFAPQQRFLLVIVTVLSGMLLLCQGAGSLFEALNAGKTVVAVPNALLMHNHQVSCCRCCCCCATAFLSLSMTDPLTMPAYHSSLLETYIANDLIRRLCS